MEQEEIVVALTEHKKEIGSLKHRVNELEEGAKAIQDIVISINKIAVNVETLTEEMKKQGERLDKIEQEPANNWNTVKMATITTIIGIIIGAIATGMM